jgi:hypothetical protein
MKEYTLYCVQVYKEPDWFDYFETQNLDLAKDKLAQYKNQLWGWDAWFKIVEREVKEKVLFEYIPPLVLHTETRRGI